ncbi:MAG: hypothetical protein AAFY71_07160 [Bacteroidota bacterium]
MFRTSFLTVILFVLIIQPLAAQNQWNLSLELLGKSFVFGSLSLEREWAETGWSAGGGIGLANIASGPAQVPVPNTMNEFVDGNRFEIGIPITLYGQKTFGKNRHHLIIPFGITGVFQRNSTFSDDIRYNNTDFPVLGFAGAGYELEMEKVKLRIPFYLMYIGEENSGIFPSVIPWLGFGWTFPLGKK